MVPRKRSDEKETFWRKAIDRQRRGGATIREFCRREGLSESSFHAGRRVIAKRDSEREDGAARGGQELVPVDVLATGQDAASMWAVERRLEIVTPGGWTLRFDSGARPEIVGEWLDVLARRQGGGAAC